jgi:hypothetical protein
MEIRLHDLYIPLVVLFFYFEMNKNKNLFSYDK